MRHLLYSQLRSRHWRKWALAVTALMLLSIGLAGALCLQYIQRRKQESLERNRFFSLGVSLSLYAEKNGNRLPPTLDALARSESEVGIKGSWQGEAPNIVYLGAGRATSELASNSVIAIELSGSNGSANVMFPSGETVFASHAELESMVSSGRIPQMPTLAVHPTTMKQ